MQRSLVNQEIQETNEAFEQTHQIVYQFVPKGYHSWRQMGYYLVCKSCDLQHSVFIGPDHLMVGEKEGKPILKKRQV